MLGNLISGFIIILLGATLAPTIANEVAGARGNSTGVGVGVNLTGSSSTIINLVTLFYCIGVATVGISVAIVGLRQGGLM